MALSPTRGGQYCNLRFLSVGRRHMSNISASGEVASSGRTLGGTLVVGVAAAFLIVAPLSLATEFEAAPHLKLLRIGLCALGTLVAVASGVLRRVGPASAAVLAFSAVYVVAAAWSPFPLAGVAYKMIFFSSIVFGLAMGALLADRETLRWAMRILGILAVAASGLVLYQYRANPAGVTHSGRLAFLGINANAVGMTAAGYLFLTAYLSLTEGGGWRIIGVLGSAVLLTLILATGSRASMAMALLGLTIQLVPWIPFPRRVLPPVTLGAVLLVFLSGSVESHAIERFTDIERNTREGMWKAGVRLFLQSPVIGHGWASRGRSTANLQNAYLQVLAETGVVGGLCMLIAAGRVLRVTIQRRRRLSVAYRTIYYFAAGIVAALALHAIAESSFLHGSTVNTFLFGLALGLLESLPQTTPASPPASTVRRPHRPRVVALGAHSS